MPEEFTLEDFAAPATDEFSLADFEEKPVSKEEALRAAITIPMEMTGRLQKGVSVGLQVAGELQAEKAKHEEAVRRIQPTQVIAPGGLFPVPQGGLKPTPQEQAEIDKGLSLISKPLANIIPEISAQDLYSAARVLGPQTVAGTVARHRATAGAEPLPEIDEGVKKVLGTVAGMEQSVARNANFFTSPAGISLWGLGGLPAVAQRAITAGIALSMAAQTPEIARELGSELGLPEDQRDYEKIGRLSGEGAVSTLLAGFVGRVPFRPGLAKEVPALEKLLTRKITEKYSPQELKAMYDRVNSLGTGTEQEIDLVKFINSRLGGQISPAFRKGIEITGQEPAIQSKFWSDYLGLEIPTTKEITIPGVTPRARRPIVEAPARPSKETAAGIPTTTPIVPPEAPVGPVTPAPRPITPALPPPTPPAITPPAAPPAVPPAPTPVPTAPTAPPAAPTRIPSRQDIESAIDQAETNLEGTGVSIVDMAGPTSPVQADFVEDIVGLLKDQGFTVTETQRQQISDQLGKRTAVTPPVPAPEIPSPPVEPGIPTGPPTAPAPPQVAMSPWDFQPALLVNNEPVVGGINHREIMLNHPDPTPELLEAFADDTKHIFVDVNGKRYSRLEAGHALGLDGPLTSELLEELRAKAPKPKALPAPPAPAPAAAPPAPPAAPAPELPPAPPEIVDSEVGTQAEVPPDKSIMGPVNEIAAMIQSGGFLKQHAVRVLDAFYGGTMAEGKYSAKDLTDAVEMGINQWILNSKISPAGKNGTQAIEDVLALKKMLAQTPTQTTRTAEMDKMQQFSTPPPHAYVVNWVANLQPGDVVLEPSAGVGGIAVFAKNTPGVTVLGNELSPRRAELLRQSGIADRVTTHNAELINAYLAPQIRTGLYLRPTTVTMNPPFSSAAMISKKNTLIGAKHVESALEVLTTGGRLVAIVGEGMAMGKPAFVPWWRKIAKSYNIRANIGISGKEYAKYGTHFANQIIIIDKTGPTKDLGAVVTGTVEKVEDLIPLLERIKNDRPSVKPAPAEPSGPPTAPTPAGAAPAPRPPVVSPGPSAPGAPGRPGGAPGPGRPPVQGPGGLGGVTPPTTVGTGGVGKPTVTPGSVTGTPPTPVDVGGGVPPASRGGEAGLTVEQKEAGELELKEHGVFSEYKPRKVHIPGSQPHSTPLVETTAMASVEPVDPKYSPKLPQELITSGALSDAQLEQIVYGGQTFELFLPNGERMGYFVGDGTGVGKGRIISGFMLDNWNRGRKKGVWISVKKELIKDATRDLTALGFKEEQIINGNKAGGQNIVGKPEGIAFFTYAGLARGNPGLEPRDPQKPGAAPKLKPFTGPKASRLHLLYDWLGKDFDGMIVFDESHKAGNAIDLRGSRGVAEASQTGMTVLDIQALFPKARILYSSATGASSVTNLSYADRLGIWGEGMPWPDKNSFFFDIQAGGLSAMEIVARDLKSMGRYLARTLSFEGVTKEQLVHNLTPDQIQIYNQLAEGWQTVLTARNEAMAHSGAANNGHARGKANSALYGAQQRFYNQLLTAMQMPSMLKHMKEMLAAGNTLIVSLVNTNEATLNRELGAKGPEEGDVDENWLDDIDLSPKQILLQYIERSFPTQLYQPEADASGNIRWKPVFIKNPDGTESPVEDPVAAAKKQEMLDRIALLDAPENPLEMILNEFGHENVAEITGRKRRLVYKKQPDGTLKQVLENRNDSKLAQEQKDVEDGKRRILVHSGKGGTGFTFSASRKFINQQRRIDYIAQAGWRSDEALQAMGRTHRNDQASAPHYVAISTNLRGHQRFISTIMRRLAEMGALTGGERKGAGGDLFDDTNNLENDYAEDAVTLLFRDLFHNRIEGMDFGEVTRQLGYTMHIFNERTGDFDIINTLLDRDGGLKENKIPTIQQFLNRILAMKFHDQNNLFDEFMDRMQQRIERAKEDGSYDPGTQTLHGNNITKLEDKVVYTHPASTAKTRLVEIQYEQPVKTISFDELNKGKPVVKYVTNIRSGKLYALKDGPNRTLESGTIVPTYRRIYPGGTDLMAKQSIDDFLQGSEAKFQLQAYATFGDAEKAWNAELAKTPKVRTLRDTYVVGAFLPIWDRLQIPDPKIWRITTKDKETFLGAHVPPGMVRDVRTRLGAGSGEAASPEATFNDILARNIKITLANGWELRRARVQGEPRIEILGLTYEEGKLFVDRMGGFMERIQFQPRHFIPTDPDFGIPVLDRVLKHSPPVGPDTTPPSGGISVGPGGASPGDVPPPPPPAAGVASQPSWSRPNGAITPSSPGLMHIVRNFRDFLLATSRQMAGQWPVKTTMADRTAGEAMAEYAASRSAALRLAKVFSVQTLQGTGVDPAKLGEALVEDNLRSIREGFRQQATEALADGRIAESEAATLRANEVVSLIGAEGSHFPDEDAYQDYLTEGPVKQAIQQHIQQWEEVIDPQFKLAMRIDPDEQLPARGLQTGARVNLKAVFPGETGVTVVGRPGASLTATFRRKSPFGRRALGAAQAYEVNYHELIANTFQKQLEIANKNKMDQALVDSGNAKIAPPGMSVEVAGERGIAFPLARRTIILPGRTPFSQSRNIYVRESLAREYRTASNVDASFQIPIITGIMNMFNKAALAGLTDFTVHMSNQATLLFTRPVSGPIIIDTLLSATGRADVPVVLVRALLKSFKNNDAQLAELAEIGSLREPPPGRNPLGRILSKTDEVTRLLMDDTFQQLVDSGLVPNTKTARREYVNQLGQYNKRMMGPLIRWLRETGFGPFVVAGRIFNVLGVKVMTLGPGAKATNAFAAAALRGNILAKWIGFFVLLGTLNYLLTKDKKGGMLGRKGTKLGDLDTGKTGPTGRPLTIPIMDILGLGRGARVTGVKGYVQARYFGLSNANALDAAARDVMNSAIGPAMGPGPRFLSIAGTGSAPGVNIPRTAPYAPPGRNQTTVNVLAGLKEANPVVRTFLDVGEGKTVGEAMGRQFPRFAMRPGMEGERAEKMPEIVNAAQLRQYTEGVAKKARELPLNQRWKFVTQKLKSDNLNVENRTRAVMQLERQGVFKYK